MPTWDDARQHLRTKYKLKKDDAACVDLGFGFRGDGRDVIQPIRIGPVAIEKTPALLIWADVVEAKRVPPEKALARNNAFTIGGLAIHQGRYVLRATLPLDALSWDTFDTVLHYIAREAARLRDSAPGGN
jgi:hypothetical protein